MSEQISDWVHSWTKHWWHQVNLKRIRAAQQDHSLRQIRWIDPWWIYFPLTIKWEANFSIVSLVQSPQSSDYANCACDHFFGAEVQCPVFEAVRWLLLSQKDKFFLASTWYFDISHSESWETKNRPDFILVGGPNACLNRVVWEGFTRRIREMSPSEFDFDLFGTGRY